MRKTIKAFLISAIVVALLSLTALTPPASAAGAIVLSSNSNVAAGSTITVTGTGFGATKDIGIGFGGEVTVTGENHTTFSGTGTGPYTSPLNHMPVKPGSFSMHWDTAGTGSDWTDAGDGTLATDNTYSAGGTINYATSVFGRSSTMDLSTYALTATCNYVYYQYKITPTAGVTSTGSGGFSASVTIPSVANGVYTITAVDSAGNKATALIGVGVDVPETFTFGIVAALSIVAVAGSAVLLRRPKTASFLGKL